MAITGEPHLRVITLQRVGTDPMGQVMATAAAESEEAATALHAGGHIVRPYSTVRDGDVIRVTCMREGVARDLARGAAKLGTLLHIGDIVTPEHLTWSPEWVRLSTRSPVQFRAGRLEHRSQSRIDMLFPHPVTILSAVHERWQIDEWPEIPMPRSTQIGGHIERYRVVPYRAGRWVHRGWEGEIVLDLRPLNAEDRAATGLLLRYAALRNVGAHTTYGMGAIDVAAMDR